MVTVSDAPRRSTGAMGLAAQEALKQPTWCRLSPDKFPVLEARAHATAPENLLFTYKNHVAGAGARAASQLRAAGTTGDVAKAAAKSTDSSQPRSLISAAADAAARGREAREVDSAPAAVPLQQAAGDVDAPSQASELGSAASLPASAGLTPGSGGPDSAAARR